MRTAGSNAECGLPVGMCLAAGSLMPAFDLRKRTREFALQVLTLVDDLPPDRITDVLVRQLVKSSTSVGANYRASCRARSPADFVAKMAIVEEEADESAYWLELLVAARRVGAARVAPLIAEADELTAIFVASIKTAKRRVR
jgi:four helix bundle protein